MENDQAFGADGDLNGFDSIHSRSSPRASQKGHDAMKAIYGSFEPPKDAIREHSPLLPPGRDRSSFNKDTETRKTGNADTRGPPKWDGERDFEGRPWWNKPSVYWLIAPFFLFTLAFGGTIVPRIDLITDLLCQEYFSEQAITDPSFNSTPVTVMGSDNPQCRIPEVQSMVSRFLLYCNLAAGLISAATSPKLGALSDRYGRVQILGITVLGMVLCEIIIIIVATYPNSFSVNWILLAYALDGLGGSFTAAMAISYAYASDCTIPDKRNVAFGYYHGCLFGGIALGPVLAGSIVKATGQILTVFYVALAAHTTFMLFLIFIVPESLSEERRIRAREKEHFLRMADAVSESPLSYTMKLLTGSKLLAPLTILWPTGEGTNPAVRRNLAFLAAVDTTMFGVAMGSMTVVILYSQYIFEWGTFETSGFVSIVNVGRVITLLVILPLVSRLLRGPRNQANQRTSGSDQIDLGIIRAAIFFDLLGYIGYCTVRTGPLFIICGAIASIGAMGSPTLQAALTKHVPPDRTGQVLGAMGLLHASARVVAPTIFNLIYAQTVGKLTQAVFVCLAATFGVAFSLSWFIRPHVYWDLPHDSVPSEGSHANVEDEAAQEDDDPGR